MKGGPWMLTLEKLTPWKKKTVKNGGSILRPEWKRFESQTRLNLNPLNGAQMRAWKTTFGGRTAKPGARNGADSCWKLALHRTRLLTLHGGDLRSTMSGPYTQVAGRL